MVQGSQGGARGALRSGDDEHEHRFSHLIQPIRDLTKNWDVDIAAQLEDYLEEIEHISITFDGGSKTMNFADAALLIQGSACVYGKKVEYLFSLVYQVLDLLASNKKLKAAAATNNANDNDATFAQRRDDDEEFLSLDDIPMAKTSTKKYEEDDFVYSSVPVMQKTPLALVSLDETQKGDNPLLSVKGEVLGSRMDFKMNSCTVHSSGFLLLDLSHLAMLKSSLESRVESTMQTAGTASTDTTPLRSAPESESNTMVAPEGNAGEGDPAPPMPDIDMNADDVFDNDDDHHEEDDMAPAAETEEVIERRQMRDRRKILFAAPPEQQQTVDVWQPLDPHQNSKTADRPLRKKKTFRLPACLKTEPSKKRKHEQDRPQSKQSLLPIADFCTQAYFSYGGKFPNNPLKVTTFPEFEDMFYQEYKRRQQRLAEQKKQLAKNLHVSDDEDEPVDDADPGDDHDDDHADPVDFQIPEIEHTNFAQDNHLQDMADVNDAAMGDDGVPVVQSYEELVRQHVDGYMAAAQQHAQLTDLARRVSEWEDQLLPRLCEEEKREAFDIHKYGSRVMDKMAARQPTPSPASPLILPFRKVVENQPPFQVCRTFLATLQLANAYNVEIIQPEGSLSDSINTLQLKLLSTRRHHEQLEEYRAPSLT